VFLLTEVLEQVAKGQVEAILIAQYLYGYLHVRNQSNCGGGGVVTMLYQKKTKTDYANYKVHNLAETKSRSDGQRTSQLSGEPKV
jgi:hypothetical protein